MYKLQYFGDYFKIICLKINQKWFKIGYIFNNKEYTNELEENIINFPIYIFKEAIEIDSSDILFKLNKLNDDIIIYIIDCYYEQPKVFRYNNKFLLKYDINRDMREVYEYD